MNTFTYIDQHRVGKLERTTFCLMLAGMLLVVVQIVLDLLGAVDPTQLLVITLSIILLLVPDLIVNRRKVSELKAEVRRLEVKRIVLETIDDLFSLSMEKDKKEP